MKRHAKNVLKVIIKTSCQARIRIIYAGDEKYLPGEKSISSGGSEEQKFHWER